MSSLLSKQRIKQQWFPFHCHALTCSAWSRTRAGGTRQPGNARDDPTWEILSAAFKCRYYYLAQTRRWPVRFIFKVTSLMPMATSFYTGAFALLHRGVLSAVALVAQSGGGSETVLSGRWLLQCHRTELDSHSRHFCFTENAIEGNMEHKWGNSNDKAVISAEFPLYRDSTLCWSLSMAILNDKTFK